jgi:hypothetical protein
LLPKQALYSVPQAASSQFAYSSSPVQTSPLLLLGHMPPLLALRPLLEVPLLPDPPPQPAATAKTTATKNVPNVRISSPPKADETRPNSHPSRQLSHENAGYAWSSGSVSLRMRAMTHPTAVAGASSPDTTMSA